MRLIDAEAFHKFIEKQDEGADYTIYHFKEWIEQQPIIEAKPVVHAHWVTEQEAEEINRYDLTYCCSACGHCDWDCTKSEGFEYCPNCGAKMDEKEG